ncbi:MAG: hypothetical protein KGH71_06415, partial [Candidatus Micrarchaeota archaeon]|nr:hypothetical protein [Candidatus Micrarchaeota archaeon]
WFRSVKLELVAFVEAKRTEDGEVRRLIVVPGGYEGAKGLKITTGNTKKSDAAKFIAKRLSYEDLDYIMQQLPAGEFSVK